MPRGSAPGERRGGRAKGTPNKARAERSRITYEAHIAAEEMLRAKNKLAKDTLDEFMSLFYAMTMRYRPLLAGELLSPGQTPNEDEFLKWARLTVKTAAQLAKFQAPKVRPVRVKPPEQGSVDHSIDYDKLSPEDAIRQYRRAMNGLEP